MITARFLLPVCCFGVSLAASLSWSCGTNGCDGCPEEKVVQTKLRLLYILPLSSPEPEVLPGLSEGTVEVTETQLIVKYSRAGSDYTVTYEIGQPTTASTKGRACPMM